MRYLGIDYGTKKVGLALSDTRGSMAFPHMVVPQDVHLVASIKSLCVDKGVRSIALGDGRSASGAENELTQHIERFKIQLETQGLEVHLVPEFGTSGAARSGMGEGEHRGTLQSKRAVVNEKHDAQAAALILQRFLDGIRHSW